ncbi:SusC/RagA family TonB-linked outer membrane protein [Plebeiibacterium sediminum]|uniref:TonB-dependent receptor n=1 Tax=Plebeiibacterium sediminum TaxID=2992112 RepID=A0AAE3M6N7_9BACT|nr:TonB-dependent receptor [Plebeiobacterium sediminum]MCW3788032.1 TonB-dependent receptor [Plebeiobacterium sediminum]
MKKMLAVILLLVPLGLLAQTISLKGRVTDKGGEPIPGVNVFIQETTKGTITNLEGYYTIAVEANQTVKFSFIGMKEQAIVYNGQATLDVTMLSEDELVDEVVVIGYQTVKKADLTGAVGVFKPDELKSSVVTGSVGEMLGTMSGVFSRTEGKPGAEGWVEIRGTKSFGSSQPLYVIDGIAVEGGANRDFNFNDIQSIQVLKDASAAAIYGSRAANGVIIITTKSGSKGPMKIEMSAKNSFQWLPKYDLTNRDQWIELNDMAFENNGFATASHFDGDTDWQEETFKTGVIEDYNISFSGGADNNNYFISANYQSNSGTTIGTESNRLTIRANTSATRDFGEKVSFKIGENIIVSNYDIDELNTNPIIDVYRMLPTISKYNENNAGGFGYGDGGRDVTFGTNPFAKEKLTDTHNQNMRVRGNVFTELSFFTKLKYKLNIGFETSFDEHRYIRKEGNWTYNQPWDPSSLNKNKARFNSMVYDNTLEYNDSFGEHTVAAVVGTSFMDQNYEQLWGSKNEILSTSDGTYFEQLNAATVDPRTGGYRDMTKLFSVFGRINYSYGDRYLFSATVRRDESSKFGPNFSHGVFPSVSGAWKISSEEFFNIPWMNTLKVRANYGVLGSSNIGPWDYVAFINSFPQAVFGTDQSVVNGQTQVKLVNDDLKWEELHQMNIGVDLSFFDNKLDVTGEYFKSETKDVLTGMQILMTTGNNGGNPNVNAATLQNTGVELSLTWRDMIGDLKYSVNANISTVKNKIIELGYGREFFTQWNTRSYVGKPIGEWYLIKTDGLFRSEQEVLNHVNSNGNLIQPNAKPGDIRYVDFNDDGTITDADRQYIGSPWPDLQLGINASLEWKGFDLQLQMAGSFGHKVFNGPRSTMDRFDDNSNYRADYDAWSLDNPNAKDPRPLYQDSRNARGNQDRWIENGSYLRLRQMALGYTVPKQVLGNAIDKVRVFVNAQNLVTFTKYNGLDPEFRNSNIWERGHDYGAFPNPKAVTIGAQLTF